MWYIAAEVMTLFLRDGVVESALDLAHKLWVAIFTFFGVKL